LSPECEVGDQIPDKPEGFEFTQMEVVNNHNELMKKFSNREYIRLLKCQSPYVIQVYAMSVTEKNSQILLIEQAKHGDIKAYYEKLIKKHMVGSKTKD